MGIPKEKLDQLNKPLETDGFSGERGRHVGLANIRQRLQYLYNRQDSFHIDSDNGTIVTLMIPKTTGGNQI